MSRKSFEQHATTADDVGDRLDPGDAVAERGDHGFGRRPFQARPWSKMWPSPSHWVEHCSGIAIGGPGAAVVLVGAVALLLALLIRRVLTRDVALTA